MKLRRRSQAPPALPEQVQHDFYTATAGEYDLTMGLDGGDEHFVALDLMSALIDGYGFQSVLDVGSGTGRAVKHLIDRHDQLDVRGIEPVRALIDQAERVNGVPEGCIIEGRGQALPFALDSVDVACEFGVLHHVPDPDEVVREMTRVARRAVFLSDDNRFGNGGLARSVAKYGLHRLGMWRFAYRLAHGGRDYHLTEEDGGVAYSYSVYDSLGLLSEWADRTFVVPTAPTRTTVLHPLFGAKNLLLCALRDG